MNLNDCDERQKAIRNGAFRHGLIFTLCVVLVDAFFVDNGMPLAEGMWGHMLLVAAAFAVVWQEMLWRDAIDYDDRSEMRFCSIFGIFGVILLVWGIVEIIGKGAGSGAFVLSKRVSELLAAICWASVGVVYWIRRICYRKAEIDK